MSVPFDSPTNDQWMPMPPPTSIPNTYLGSNTTGAPELIPVIVELDVPSAEPPDKVSVRAPVMLEVILPSLRWNPIPAKG